MEAVRSSKMSLNFYQATRLYIPEDSTVFLFIHVSSITITEGLVLPVEGVRFSLLGSSYIQMLFPGTEM
jgi:hypothetical protein